MHVNGHDYVKIAFMISSNDAVSDKQEQEIIRIKMIKNDGGHSHTKWEIVLWLHLDSRY